MSGYSKKCRKIAYNLYKIIAKKVYLCPNIETAEMTKLVENCYRSVNISLVNEFKIISEKLGINIWEVLKAARTKNFGYRSFRPGPGTGGHCIPIDPFYLSWVSKKNNYNPKMLMSASKINEEIPKWTINQIKKVFKNKKISKKNILLLGVAYKKDVDDTRESPSVKLFQSLIKNNFNVYFNDPYIKKINFSKKNFFSSTLKYSNLSKYSCIIIATDHSSYNFKKILKYSKNIIDTRGVYRNFQPSEKINFC